MFNSKDHFTKNISILYVEDNLDIAQEVYEILSFSFEHIYRAQNGQDALALFKKHTPDIVLTDIQMPIMNGIEMSKEIKKISPETPIIIASAFDNSKYLKDAIDIGISDYILKPVNFNRVTEALDKIISNLYNQYELEQYHKNLELTKNQAVAENEAKSMFLASMSHEIRTPLNAITGFIDIISNEFKDEKLLSYVKIINDNSESLLGIINDILDFNKIESGQLDIVEEYFDIHDTTKNVVDLFRAKADEKTINLSLTIDEEVPKICKTDPLRLRQILSNLLSNAIKFTPVDGEIQLHIKILSTSNEICFSVEDSGIGIAKEYQKTIFEAFTQAEATTTKKYGGTGLGLSISHKLSIFLGGELKVESELEKGSRFSLTIAAQCLDENSQHEYLVVEKDEDIDFKGKHVLLVEDNKSNQMFMDITLDSIELSCEIANNGQEAVEMFKSTKYDLILMDENMPVMNGIEATEAILSLEEEMSLTHTPIIALTANALKGDRERFLSVGMDEYLTKPLEKKKLIKAIKGVLKL